jgi:hypothetical protein
MAGRIEVSTGAAELCPSTVADKKIAVLPWKT